MRLSQDRITSWLSVRRRILWCCTLFMPSPDVVWPEAYCFLSRLSVRACVHTSARPCVRPKTSLTRYLAEYLTDFHQTYINDALLVRDERFTV